MAGNANNEAESQTSGVISVGDVSIVTVPDDIFLSIQRATSALSKIYTELFVKTKNEFMSELSNNCDVTELRYVRDMMYPMVKRRTSAGQLGQLVDRKSGDHLKDKLIKDIYNLYLFGEGSISALPKHMLKSDSKFVDMCVQTDSCLSGTLFASKTDLENLKAELLNKIANLKQDILSETVKSPSSDSNHISLPSAQSQPVNVTPGSLPSQVSPNDSILQIPNSVSNVTVCDIPEGSQVHSIPEKARKIVIAGDSLLHRMNANKMSVNGIPCQKLTKKGDSLSGSVYRSKQFISKHGNEHIDLVLLAGTNDLSNRSVSPEDLIDKLDECISELKGFSNLGHIFLCQIPNRFDFHAVNSKVILFNELLSERYSDTEDFLTVISSIPPEFRYYYEDSLHLSNIGLSKFCSIIMSYLYRVLAPSNFIRCKPARLSRSRR